MDQFPLEFSYVIQVEVQIQGTGERVDRWTTVKSGLTMDEAYGVLEAFRRVNPSREFRLIPTDWIDL